MSDSKWDIGDNVKTVLIAFILMLQLWLKADNSNIKQDATDAKAAADANAARIKAVATELRDARNESRRAMGLPPVPAPKDDPE